MKPGPCLSPSVVDRPTRPTKHQRLGKLYPTNYLILDLIISNRRTFLNISGIFLLFSLRRDRIVPKLEVDTNLLLTRTPWHKPFDSHVFKQTYSLHSEPGSNSFLIISLKKNLIVILINFINYVKRHLRKKFFLNVIGPPPIFFELIVHFMYTSSPRELH